MSQYWNILTNALGNTVSLNKKIDLKTIILTILKEKEEVRLQDIAQASGLSAQLSKNRRAIQRALKNLITSEIIEPRGQARARVYQLKNNLNLILKENPSPYLIHPTNPNEYFKDIPLSEKSIQLLDYLSQSIQARHPVGYNQEFLLVYEPNKSAYLNDTVREELLAIGCAGNVMRPVGTYARAILNRLLIDLSWNSSRLEGNTYSLFETKRLIELGENALGKSALEAQMILNHKRAIEYIVESEEDKKISSHEICNIHALLSENLLPSTSASGRLRTISVGVSGTTYMPLKNLQVLKMCFEIFIEKLNLIEDPFEQSFFSLVHLSYLQAFEDVNKRTSRLVANIPFIKNNLNPLSFTDVNQQDYVLALLGVYEKNDLSLFQDLYAWAYKKSAKRYSGVQQAAGELNLLKLHYHSVIHDIIRKIILEETAGQQILQKIRYLLSTFNLPKEDSAELFKLIEIELVNLHEGNIAQFKLQLSEFQKWRDL